MWGTCTSSEINVEVHTYEGGYEGGYEPEWSKYFELLPHIRIKSFLAVLRRMESKMADSHQNRTHAGHLVCAASTLPQSYNNQTTMHH